MSIKPRYTYLGLDGGLNTYANPHMLAIGTVIGASGATMDRPGYVYPGPTLSASIVTSYNYLNAYERYGLITYTAPQPTSNDMVLGWASRPNEGLLTTQNVGLVGSVNSNNVQGSVWPVRMATKKIAPSGYVQTPTYTPGTYTNFAPVACNFTGPLGPAIAYGYTCNNFAEVVIIAQDIATGEMYPAYRQAIHSPNGGFQLFSDGAGNLYYAFGNIGVNGVGIYAMTLTGTTSYTWNANLIYNVGYANLYGIDAVSSRTGAGVTEPGYVVIIWDTPKKFTVVNVLNGTATSSYTSPSLGTGPISVTPLALWVDDSQTLSTNVFSTTYLMVFISGGSADDTYRLNLAATTLVNSGESGISIGSGQITATSGAGGTIYVAIEGGAGGTFASPNTGFTNQYQYSNITVKVFNIPFALGAATAGPTVYMPGGAWLAGKAAKFVTNLSSTNQSLIDDICFPIRSGVDINTTNYYPYDDGAFGTAAVTPLVHATPCGFLIDKTGALVAKWGSGDFGTPGTWPTFGIAGPNSTYQWDTIPRLSQAVRATADAGSDHSTIWPWPQISQVIGAFGKNQPASTVQDNTLELNVSIVELIRDTNVIASTKAKQLGNTLMISGGMNMALTNTTDVYAPGLIPAGFPLPPGPPQIVSFADDTTMGGAGLPAGTASSCLAVYQFIDASGRTFWSGPSVPFTYTVPTTTSGYASINVFVPYDSTLPPGTNVLLYECPYAQYSSTAAQVPFYYSGQMTLDTTSISGVTVYSCNLAPANSQANLASQNYIYTSGWTSNAAGGAYLPPPFDSLCVWQNAFFGIANRAQPELWFSYPNDTSALPRAPMWLANNRLPLPAELGVPLGLAALDGNLIIFGTNADYTITGTLPAVGYTILDNPGLLSAPSVLPTPGGLKVRNAVTVLPTGVLFQGTNGFTLLDRSLTYNQVGLPVQNFTNAGLYGPGILYPEQSCVLLPPIDNISPPLMYYYNMNKWSIPAYDPAGLAAPNQAAWQSAAGAVRARFTKNTRQIVAADLNVANASVNIINAGGGYLQAQTAWFEMEDQNAVAAVQQSVAGYGQLFEVQVQGDLLTPISHTITLETEYDYPNNTVTPPDVQTITNNINTVAASAPQPWPDWQWRFTFATTQARRVRFTVTFQVTDTANLTTGDPVVLISGLMVYFGVEDGLSRLGQSASAGYGTA